MVGGEAVGEVEAIDEGGGVHPMVGGEDVAGGRLLLEEGHAHVAEGVGEGGWAGGVGGGGAKGGGDELERGFDFVAEAGAGVEFGEWARVRRRARMSPPVWR